MNERFHSGTFIWGVVLTIAGAGLLGVGLDLWELSRINLNYVAPILVIVIGASILFGSLRRTRENS
jgi:membrane protein DedA with SNARE-associated domain